MVDSGGALEPLPMGYAHSLEPLLNRLGEFQPNSLRRPLVEITAVCWAQGTLFVATRGGSMLVVDTTGNEICVDLQASVDAMFPAGQSPSIMVATKDSILAACAVSDSL